MNVFITIDFEDDRTYRVEFTISNFTGAGYSRILIYSENNLAGESDYTAGDELRINSTGKHSFDVTLSTSGGSSSNKVIIQSYSEPSSYTISDVSIKKYQLTGYWRNNGLATWNDLSTNSNNGAVSNFIETMLITAGVDGSRDSQGFLMNRQRATNSLNLATLNDSQDDYVDASMIDSVNNIWNGGGTFSCWMKAFGDGGSDVGRIADKSSGASGDNGWTLLTTSSDGTNISIRMHRAWSSNTPQWNSPVDISLNEWHHIVITYNDDSTGNDPIFYVDGSSVTVTESGGVGAPSGTREDDSGQELIIGKAQNLGDRGFDGEIDDVCIYNDILGATEAKRNYNAGKRSHR